MRFVSFHHHMQCNKRFGQKCALILRALPICAMLNKRCTVSLLFFSLLFFGNAIDTLLMCNNSSNIGFTILKVFDVSIYSLIHSLFISFHRMQNTHINTRKQHTFKHIDGFMETFQFIRNKGAHVIIHSIRVVSAFWCTSVYVPCHSQNVHFELRNSTN